MAAMNERPPMTIRANTLRITREALAARLRDEELAETRPTALAPEGLIVERGAVGALGRLHRGVVHDPGRGVDARRAPARPEAGRAGRRRVRGAGHQGDAHGRADGQSRPDRRDRSAGGAAPARRASPPRGSASASSRPTRARCSLVGARCRGRCDRVLVDAPCSNLGVLRRNPDVKWRRTAEDLRPPPGKAAGHPRRPPPRWRSPAAGSSTPRARSSPTRTRPWCGPCSTAPARLAGRHPGGLPRGARRPTASSAACPTCTAPTASPPSGSGARPCQLRPGSAAPGRRNSRDPTSARSAGQRFSFRQSSQGRPSVPAIDASASRASSGSEQYVTWPPRAIAWAWSRAFTSVYTLRKTTWGSATPTTTAPCPRMRTTGALPQRPREGGAQRGCPDEHVGHRVPLAARMLEDGGAGGEEGAHVIERAQGDARGAEGDDGGRVVVDDAPGRPAAPCRSRRG